MEVQPGTSLLGLTTDLVARVAVPKPARRVGLVRRLVLREPDVAIDAEHRALGVARDLRREPRKPDVHFLDQRTHRIADVVLITLALRLEPRLVVVPGEAAQKGERGGSEHGRAKLAHSRGTRHCLRLPIKSTETPCAFIIIYCSSPPRRSPASRPTRRPARRRRSTPPTPSGPGSPAPAMPIRSPSSTPPTPSSCRPTWRR